MVAVIYSKRLKKAFEIFFSEEGRVQKIKFTKASGSYSPPLSLPQNAKSFCKEFQKHIDGIKPSYRVDYFDWKILSHFQKKVLKKTLKIPFGQTLTYAEIALKVENPKATRAVGTALGRNPIPIAIPCHRVLPKSGQLGNYSGLGGKRTKNELLSLENAIPGLSKP